MGWNGMGSWGNNVDLKSLIDYCDGDGSTPKASASSFLVSKMLLLLLLVVPVWGKGNRGEKNKRGKSHREANPIGSATPRKWPYVFLSHTDILHTSNTNKDGPESKWDSLVSLSNITSHHRWYCIVLCCMMMRKSIVRWRWVQGHLLACVRGAVVCMAGFPLPMFWAQLNQHTYTSRSLRSDATST